MEYPWLWLGFAVLVVVILALDLGLTRREHELSTRQALGLVAAYVLLALAFGAAIFWRRDTDAALEYYTAYLLEQSLSLDNIFIWVLIFEHLKIPDEDQQAVLFWGILGAMVLRGVFIFAGTALISAFDWLLYLFGALVIFSGAKLLHGGGRERDIGKSRVLRFLRRRLNIAEERRGTTFFVERHGQRYATPLFIALIVIETTDIVFALDSIPAIFGVTRDPLIVYTSNILAVLGLRALYFAVAGLIEHLKFLRYGLALLLVMIGLKMIGSHFVEVPIWMTLGVTLAILAGTVVMSLWWQRRGRPA